MKTNKRPVLIFLVIVLIAATLLLSTSCKKTSEPEATATPSPTPTPTPTPATSMSEIQQKGRLVVAVEAAHPPYIYVKRTTSGFEIMGPEYELVKAIAEDLGVELYIKDVKTDDIFIGLELGLYDMAVACITPTDLLKKQVAFSDQYFIDEYPLIINAAHAGDYTDSKSFKDKRVGALRKTTQYDLAKDLLWYPRMKGYETETDMIDNLLTGGDDGSGYLAAICMEAYRARYYMNKYPELVYSGIVLSEVDSPTGYAVAMANDKQDLVTYVNTLLADLQEDTFMLTKLGISETDYSKCYLEVDTACSDYLGILYGK